MSDLLQISSRSFWVMVLILAFCGVPTGIFAESYVCEYGQVDCETPTCGGECVVERVSLNTQECDGSSSKLVREGVLHRYKKAKGTVLISHGFMCNKEDVGFLRHLFPRGDYNVMTFDFRAHGNKSDGQHCTLGRDEAHDVIAAAKFLRNHPKLKKLPLFVYGFSMGAVASIEAQARDSTLFDAMILDCPFDSSETVIRKGLEKLKFSLFGYKFELPGRSLLERYAFQPYVQAFIRAALKTVAHMDTSDIPVHIQPFSPSDSIKKVSVPCLFIHCKNDEKVPVASVRSLFDAMPGYKRLWLSNGRRHFDSYFYNPEQYVDHVRSFMDAVMSGEVKRHPGEHIIEDPDDERVVAFGT